MVTPSWRLNPGGDPFTVSVEAGFAEDGIWRIDARLRFRDGSAPLGSDLLGEGRLALLAGITREGLRGRSLGAKIVRVHLDTGDRVRDVGLMEIIADPDTLR